MTSSSPTLSCQRDAPAAPPPQMTLPPATPETSTRHSQILPPDTRVCGTTCHYAARFCLRRTRDRQTSPCRARAASPPQRALTASLKCLSTSFLINCIGSGVPTPACTHCEPELFEHLLSDQFHWKRRPHPGMHSLRAPRLFPDDSTGSKPQRLRRIAGCPCCPHTAGRAQRGATDFRDMCSFSLLLHARSASAASSRFLTTLHTVRPPVASGACLPPLLTTLHVIASLVDLAP